jgi:hypothetical protein
VALIFKMIKNSFQIQSFTALIGDLDPEVSAAGYFEIGKNLIQAVHYIYAIYLFITSIRN